MKKLHALYVHVLSKGKSIKRKLRRFEYFNVETQVEVPLNERSSNFNTVTLSTREKTLKLVFDHRNRCWKLWAPTNFTPRIHNLEKGIAAKYVGAGYRWDDLAPAFVKLVEEQRAQGAPVVKLHMHATQLTKKPLCSLEVA